VSRPRKPGRAWPKPDPAKKGPRKSLPEELARDAVAHEKAAPGDSDLVLRVRLSKAFAEALTGSGSREEKNLTALVAKIPEAAARDGRS
jgi:hypothetical protein